jgi:hypothetical protein
VKLTKLTLKTRRNVVIYAVANFINPKSNTTFASASRFVDVVAYNCSSYSHSHKSRYFNTHKYLLFMCIIS